MSIERTEPTAQPSTSGYRKLSDFIQPPQEHFRETQEISVIPRMKLPTINLTTGESTVPWVAVWSNKGKVSSIPTYKSIEQTPYTPIPTALCDIDTVHLPTVPYLQAASRANNRINAFIFTENETQILTERSPRKSRTGSFWKYISTIVPRFRTRIRRHLKASFARSRRIL